MQVNKIRLLFYSDISYASLISPIAHSNISRGVREIFLYPIRDYSLGGKQILLLFPSWCLSLKYVDSCQAS